MRRPLLITTMALTLLLTSGGAVAAQEDSSGPGVSPTPEQLAEERLATATCLGKPATIVAVAGIETVGTPDADVIVGTEGDDLIRGEGGNDRICAGDGADFVEGGEGKDRIDGGAGDDQLDGGTGNDRLSGNAGDDTLDGGKGNDVCNGGPGHDWFPACNDKRGTRGKLVVRKNTALKGPHRGSIVIEASKVTLDCRGHTVSGRGGGDGIFMEGRSGVTIKDCHVANFTHGVRLFDSNRNLLTGNRANENGLYGVFLERSSRNRLVGNVADENGFGSGATVGFETRTSRNNVFKRNSANGNGEANFGGGGAFSTYVDNTASGGGFGFETGGDHNEYRNNTVSGAQHYAFHFGDGDDNVATGNLALDSGVGFFTSGSGNTVTGNTALNSSRFGFEEWSTAGANDYVDNVCIGSGEHGSSPLGLCSTTPRPTPEPSQKPPSETNSGDVSLPEG